MRRPVSLNLIANSINNISSIINTTRSRAMAVAMSRGSAPTNKTVDATSRVNASINKMGDVTKAAVVVKKVAKRVDVAVKKAVATADAAAKSATVVMAAVAVKRAATAVAVAKSATAVMADAAGKRVAVALAVKEASATVVAPAVKVADVVVADAALTAVK